MTSHDLLDATLELLSGGLQDSTGVSFTPRLGHVHLARAKWRGIFVANRVIRATLDAGRRVAVPIPFPVGRPMARFIDLLFARARIWRAVRVLRRCGVPRIRVFAAVAGADALFVVYELGATAQPYVEQLIIFNSEKLAPPARLVRAALRACANVAPSVDLLVVVGDLG